VTIVWLWKMFKLFSYGWRQRLTWLFMFVYLSNYRVWLQMGFRLVTTFIACFDTVHDYILQFTITHILVSTVTSSLSLLGSGFQWWKLPFLWVPERSPPQLPASNSNSSQRQNRSSSLTGWLQVTVPAYNISSQSAQKILFLCCNAVVA
jgi:hypothetical protein